MPTDDRKPLGKILLQHRLISQKDLEQALRDQQKAPVDHGVPLASQLIASGLVSEVDALRALSEQQGVPGIDLSQIAVLLEHLELVPREISETHEVLPVLVRGDAVFLAMADPSDKRIIDELEFVTGKKVYPYVALSTILGKTIADAYDAKARGDTYYLGPNVPDETLKQLGIQRGSSLRALAGTPGPGSGKMEGAPPRVVDQAMERAGALSEISTSEFGSLGSEVSSVASLPDELRSSSRPSGTVGGKTILVVDDEEDIRRLLRRLLADKGFRVIEADRGTQALRLVKEKAPDLIILDAMLPELHGFDIARRIKGSEKYGAIPIIMISAVYRGWRIAEDLKANYGIEEYLEKPFKISDVLAAVNRLIADRAARASQRPPRDPEAVNADADRALQKGIAAYRAGQLDEAIESLKYGVGLDPLAYRLRYHLALLYGKKGMVFEGISELERAVEMNPKHFPALKNLAVLYEKAAFRHKAIEMWERCIHLAPDAPTRESIKEHLLSLL